MGSLPIFIILFSGRRDRRIRHADAFWLACPGADAHFLVFSQRDIIHTLARTVNQIFVAYSTWGSHCLVLRPQPGDEADARCEQCYGDAANSALMLRSWLRDWAAFPVPPAARLLMGALP